MSQLDTLLEIRAHDDHDSEVLEIPCCAAAATADPSSNDSYGRKLRRAEAVTYWVIHRNGMARELILEHPGPEKLL